MVSTACRLGGRETSHPAKLCAVHAQIRAATPVDFERIGEIGAEGDSADTNPCYLSFVAATGRLLVAEGDQQLLAFGGMVPAGPVAMVTDLFVASSARGHGLGGALLAELVSGWPHRMTCSSQQPVALSAYHRVGMVPRWHLLYLEGSAIGGGPPLPSAPWAHDRAELVEFFADGGATVSADVVVQPDPNGGATVLRLRHSAPVECMKLTLAALPPAVRVRACVPAFDPLADWLLAEGFQQIDHDIFCSTDQVAWPADLSCAHPGLA